MSLDLSQTLPQLRALVSHMRGERDSRAARLADALRALERADADAMRRRASEAEGRVSFLAADPLGPPGERHATPSTPASYCALSVDGSHIDVDRHLPVRCALINLGGCVLNYGASPDARFFSRPRLYSVDDGLSLPDPESPGDGTPLQGALLGLKRSVDEVVELAERAQDLPPDPSAGSGQALPTVALIDGTIILWELGGQAPPGGRYPSYVREHFLKDPEHGLLPAFDRLRAVAQRRRLVLASYISLPGATEVVNALRLALCAYPPDDRRAFCQHPSTPLRTNGEDPCPCSGLHDFVDRDLFGRLLSPGERSGLFRTRSSVVREYREHAVCFFYLNVGREIARVEVPQWVAEDAGLVGLVHAVALDQCRRGNGYPPVIQEAHEQAVISAADRQEFRRLVEETLEGERLPTYTSQKQESKRGRWV